MSYMLKQILLATIGWGVLSWGQGAPEPMLRSNARLVLLDVVVTNDKGPVRGLTRDDFIVEDKGKKQAITVFEVSDGSEAVPASPLPAGIYSNRINRLGQVQRSATVVLYDRINTFALDQAFVRAQVLRLLAGLKETDRVGFFSLGFALQQVWDFNEDAAPLARVAKALLASGDPPAEFSAADKQLFKNLAEALSPMQQLQNQARVNITYPAFRTLARHLAGVPGRKNVLWVTSMFPLTFGNQVERRKNDEAEVEAFKNNLTEANITLYPVDPGGTGASFNQSEGAPVANEGSLMPGSMRNAAGTSSANNTPTSLTGNQTMLLLANATGGKAYRNMNDIEPALREVISSTDYSYTLGFTPDEKTLDNKVHELKVSLVKKPATEKARLTHRKQYLAWGPKAPPEARLAPSLEEIIADPVPATGVGLMAVVNADPAKPGVQVLDIRVSAADIQFQPQGDQWTARFDIAISVEGRPGASVKTYNPTVNSDLLRQILAGGMDVRESLEVGPGPGVFRISLLDAASGKAGALRVPFGAQ
jgi:VWFA-related protein